jgi:hypothetical protein
VDRGRQADEPTRWCDLSALNCFIMFCSGLTGPQSAPDSIFGGGSGEVKMRK